MPRSYHVKVGRRGQAHARVLTDSLGLSDAVSVGPALHGIDVNASNTGHRGTPTPSGVPAGLYTLDQSFLDTYLDGLDLIEGLSFDGVEFNGYETGLAVTFVDCLLDGMAFQYTGTANGLLWLDHCTAYGTLDPYGNLTDYEWSQYAGFNLSHLKLTACDIWGYGQGTIHCGSTDVTVEDSYVHDPAPHQSVANGGPGPDGTHHGLTTLQFAGCSNVTIRRCHYKAYRGTPSGFDWTSVSSALTIYNDSYHPGPIAVEDNYFASGGVIGTYWGALSSKTEPWTDNITATGNIFGREILRYCGSDSAANFGDFTSPSVWSNNTWGALGVAPGGDPAEGSSVSAPTPG